MSLNALMDPIGFIADVIAICNALGIQTPYQRKESEQLLKEIDAIERDISNIKCQIAQCEKKFKNAIASALAVEVRSRLPSNLAIGTQAIDSVIKLLFVLKLCSANVAFAIVIRYMIGNRPATLGMAASTTDDFYEMIKKLSDLARSTMGSKRPMTTFVSARCRGKLDLEAENVVSAVLCCLVTEALGLPYVGGAESIQGCELIPSGQKTIVLLRPEPVEREWPEYDHFCRIFLVGDTRTGKSSLGNALTKTESFTVSKGMTGTLHIGCHAIPQISDGYRCLTEVYDTPGLNDKDGLDVYHQAAIEDKIVGLQQANALLLTIAVDAGITNSARRAIEQYKILFGEKMAKMLIIVLTTNESADKSVCDDLIEFNWQTVSGLVEGIRKSSVICISLEDLRSKYDSYSHAVVRLLLTSCQAMPMKLIDSMRMKYNRMRKAILEKRGEVHVQVDEMVKDGWLAYEELTSSFESAPRSQVASEWLNGFVYKQSIPTKMAVTVATLGALNLIRKFAIHLDFPEPHGRDIWDAFRSQGLKHSAHAMRIFGDMLHEAGLAVLVKTGKPTMCGTLRIQRSHVTVFNPAYRVLDVVLPFFRKLLAEEQHIAPDVAEALRNLVIPKVYGKRILRGRQGNSR